MKHLEDIAIDEGAEEISVYQEGNNIYIDIRKNNGEVLSGYAIEIEGE